MGWSCSYEAGKTLRRMNEVFSSDPSATYKAEDGRRYFIEPSTKEHNDGAVTGSVMWMISQNPDGSGSVKKVGSFRIDPNGEIARAPKWLKKLHADAKFNEDSAEARSFARIHN